jgi:hypothetical protein
LQARRVSLACAASLADQCVQLCRHVVLEKWSDPCAESILQDVALRYGFS